MSFTPRLTDSGMQNNKYWYSENPFYISGYGLPNCTCYAWGRTWEIAPLHKPTLPTGNAETWYGNVGLPYTKGTTPKIGAIMCWSHPSSGGHVAIVEKINGDTITTSNSAWGGQYFYTKTYTVGNEDNGKYKFQGYIYNPYVDGTLPPRPTKWISRASALNREEMENNALIVIYTYRALGYDDRTIASLLGNMQAESSINPERIESGGGGGYGLVQWTPQSVLQNHCTALGLSPYNSGDVQLKVIPAEVTNTPSSVAEWYSTEAFVKNYYNSGATADMIGIKGSQFLSNEMGWSPSKLAVLFMACYERPSYDPDVNHYKRRQQYAEEWYEYMGGVVPPPTPIVIERTKFPIPLLIYMQRRKL